MSGYFEKENADKWGDEEIAAHIDADFSEEDEEELFEDDDDYEGKIDGEYEEEEESGAKEMEPTVDSKGKIDYQYEGEEEIGAKEMEPTVDSKGENNTSAASAASSAYMIPLPEPQEPFAWVSQLKDLRNLHTEGALSHEEFKKAKDKLLETKSVPILPYHRETKY